MKEGQIDKTEINNLGLKAIKNYFLVDPSEITNKEALTHLLQKAKLGMQFEREMSVSKRSGEMMSFRIMKLTSEDKNELKKYIKKAMPQYLPR
jgi:hypothetical protein